MHLEFTWYPGFSVSQKRKSIQSLHAAAESELGLRNVLEVSTKSPDPTGEALSAFKLRYVGERGSYYLESIYQSSKVFQRGGPYSDIRDQRPAVAKADPRLKESGPLIAFSSNSGRWGLDPPTAFYDWLYLHTLELQRELAERAVQYSGFTDIEFNPKRSISCQAHSAALYVSLAKRGLLVDALKSKDGFLATLARFEVEGRGASGTHANLDLRLR